MNRDDITDQPEPSRRRVWVKRVAVGTSIAAGLAAIAVAKRNGVDIPAAAKTVRAYAPRPNKDVTLQLRDPLGRFSGGFATAA